MLVTIDWIKRNYEVFNEKYFNNELPMVNFKISRAKNTWGYASYKIDRVNNTIIPYELKISNYYDSPERIKLNTLLHEMIHIYDYTKHPHRFFNHRKISNRTYDAHGWWFKEQCERINADGWDVATNVQNYEIADSTLSAKSQLAIQRKLRDSVIVVIWGTKNAWMIKTSKSSVTKIFNRIAATNWKWNIGSKVSNVTVHSFTDENFASHRNNNSTLRGWRKSISEMQARLKQLNATEIKVTQIKSLLNKLDAQDQLECAA